MSSESSDLIFTVRKNATQVVDETEESNTDTKILSMIWKNGKLGAAYFDCVDKSLRVYEERIDASPRFFLTSSIYREVSPKYLISVGKINDDHIKHLMDTVTINDATVTTDTMRTLPPNMFLLSPKEYSFDICRSVLLELNLFNTNEMSDTEKELHVNSLINFDYKTSVYAAGALVKYLDKNWAHFLSDREEFQYLSVLQTSLRGHVLMDWTTLNALQIFQQCSHDAGFKRGLQGSSREGLSVFKLFSSSCKSRMGQAHLRSMLLRPINDIRELTKRLDFVNFVLHPGHQEFVESLQDNIKKLADVTGILIKIKNSRANCQDWKTLYRSIYHAIYTSELVTPYRESCDLLNEYCNCITIELVRLENSINDAIDFTDNKLQGRPAIKMGLDESLDAKKLRRQDIAQHVTAAAQVAAQQLPEYLHECAIVYLPEMGHLIAVAEWEPNCDPDSLKELGFHYMFTLRNTIHYKNPLCQELDESLGDVNAEIIAHENRILQRLSSFIIKYNRDIREPLRILAEIDALIAVAKVSAQNNYVRPSLNTENKHEIQDCRHPLLELVSGFEPNDFFSGGDHSHIKIITGPNGSGKSIYLKNVALAVYLGHIGSYVPAKTANIGMMHSIHTRMQATESACVRLSAFMIDVIQATQAIHNAAPNSFILLDEFGRGTTTEEGFALLVGFLLHFYKMDKNCPHIVVSTHQQRIVEHLPQSSLVEYFKMAHTDEDGELLFLYKVTKGISNSFAINIAAQIGIDDSIIKEAKRLFDNKNVLEPREMHKHPSSKAALMELLQNVEIPEPDD